MPTLVLNYLIYRRDGGGDVHVFDTTDNIERQETEEEFLARRGVPDLHNASLTDHDDYGIHCNTANSVAGVDWFCQASITHLRYVSRVYNYDHNNRRVRLHFYDSNNTRSTARQRRVRFRFYPELANVREIPTERRRVRFRFYPDDNTRNTPREMRRIHFHWYDSGNIRAIPGHQLVRIRLRFGPLLQGYTYVRSLRNILNQDNVPDSQVEYILDKIFANWFPFWMLDKKKRRR